MADVKNNKNLSEETTEKMLDVNDLDFVNGGKKPGGKKGGKSCKYCEKDNNIQKTGATRTRKVLFFIPLDEEEWYCGWCNKTFWV
ncbi:hypothetical protein [Pseudobutyrivibrio sp. MD2005]|uniref:hypothetical protein n=1 Tax=Pseudobutyrivibrio sp. MD2005 TaxID=1410616 RepID=UPI00048A08C6|nr:hypothetical protein [Pseudobutyrivibrio sp. MD2005]